MIAGNRFRQIGWLAALALCFGCFVALSFRVNTVKSEVRLAERRIVLLEREKLLLETEFETRANQQQLADWNATEFGYKAPRADQYVAGERQLASLGVPRAIGAPAPIRVAHAPESDQPGNFPQLVSPLSGRPLATGPGATGDAIGMAVAEARAPSARSSRVASDFARAFGEATPIVARVAEVVE